MKRINFYIKYIFLLVAIGVMATSCTDDLDRFPPNKSTGAIVYSDIDGYRGAAAKIYLSMATPGNEGPAGQDDLTGFDVGTLANFLRSFFDMQELATEEAICCWDNPGIPAQNFINYSDASPIIKGMYYRLGINITFANDFIKHTDEATLNSKGFSDAEKQEILGMRDQVRFLRAFFYWGYIDLFGNVPFFTETHQLGTLPRQGDRAEVFSYIESELLDVAGEKSFLKAPKGDVYGRVDKGAAYALLARLYLNAQVYTGTARWDDAATYAEKAITSGYSLMPTYANLFLADNDKNNNETILTINFNGQETKSFGGTTFLINSSFQTKMAGEFGINYGITSNAGWGGNRARLQLSEKFKDGDKRNMFVYDNPSVDIVSDFDKGGGRATYKWRNVTSTGANGSNAEFADTDYPLFRLAEMYLIYAEAFVRGATTATQAKAMTYINLVRARAFGDTNHNYTSMGQITLDEILDERARELYWESHRRTDLVRYGYFTSSSYVWQWKGGVKGGRGVSSHYNLYPIPADDLITNSNLKQNRGYGN